MEFLVGRNGDFDQLVSSAIRRCKREIRDNNGAHVWVLPYVTADYRDNEDAYRAYYDEIEVFGSGGSHYKAAFQARNRSMVDRSHLVVFFVERKRGRCMADYALCYQAGQRICKPCTSDQNFLGNVIRNQMRLFLCKN